jgi:acetyl esterase/lipase
VAGLAPRGQFEGADNANQSSAVRCILDAYGPTQFDVMDAQAAQEQPALQSAAVTVMPGRGNPGGPPPPAMQHDPPASAESRLVGAAIQTVPERVRAANPVTYVRGDAPPFLIMHGLADNSVPHGQSVLLYEALKAANTDVTLRLVDGLPHTFFNRTDLDEAAGPFRMDVREHPRGGPEARRVDRAGVFAVARAFFQQHLR